MGSGGRKARRGPSIARKFILLIGGESDFVLFVSRQTKSCQVWPGINVLRMGVSN